jgi:hypothetical protein
MTLILLILVIVLGSHTLTLRNEGGPENTQFRAGVTPTEMPDGVFKGIPPAMYRGSWVGKRIVAAEARGINQFEWADIKSEQYPFRMYVEKGLRDKDLEVLVFDYSSPLNPWWLRWGRDEIREIAPGKFIGKIYARIIPGLPTLIGYFGMNKE